MVRREEVTVEAASPVDLAEIVEATVEVTVEAIVEVIVEAIVESREATDEVDRVAEATRGHRI